MCSLSPPHRHNGFVRVRCEYVIRCTYVVFRCPRRVPVSFSHLSVYGGVVKTRVTDIRETFLSEGDGNKRTGITLHPRHVRRCWDVRWDRLGFVRVVAIRLRDRAYRGNLTRGPVRLIPRVVAKKTGKFDSVGDKIRLSGKCDFNVKQISANSQVNSYQRFGMLDFSYRS